MSSGGGAPQLSAALIDLATYGELESYMYGPVDTRDYNGMYPLKGVILKQNIKMCIIILVIFFLIYIKR